MWPGAGPGPGAVRQAGPCLPDLLRAQPGTGTRAPTSTRPQVRARAARSRGQEGGRQAQEPRAGKGWSL